jgi:phosphoglycerate kinase
MATAFRTLDEADVGGKRVLLRVDLNVPMDHGRVTDLTRIERVAPTITELAGKGAKVILLAHFGRPKGRDPKESLRPVAAAVATVVGRPVAFAEDCVGPQAEAAITAMELGDILCLENTRFHKAEEKNDPAFVAALAALGDIYVNDAFSAAHRAHASTEGIAHKLPAFAGRSMQAELEALTRALEAPQRPLAAIVGGAKISTKLELLGNLIAKVDALVIGGAMANTFLAAQGRRIGKSLAEHDLLDTAREILAAAAGRSCEILLPVDAIVAADVKAHAPSRVVAVEAVGDDDRILDIGPASVAAVIARLDRAKTLVWNGPVGAFELPPFDAGTAALARAVADRTAAGRLVSVAGGGDTVAALNAAGVAEHITYISTAGGAFLEWLEGKPLPGVEILRAR